MDENNQTPMDTSEIMITIINDPVNGPREIIEDLSVLSDDELIERAAVRPELLTLVVKRLARKQ